MADFPDYYKLLGVTKTATHDEIRKAFRKLARKYHPDVAEDKSTAEEKFKEINEAYEVLGDKEKRKQYDDMVAMGGRNPFAGAAGGGFRGFPGGGAGYGQAQSGEWQFEGTGFSDFFEQVFGQRARQGGFPGGHAGAAQSGSRRGSDVESEILVSLREVIDGAERLLRLRSADGTSQEVRVRIPKGVSEGKLIRAKGLGGPGRNGGEPGDLFLHVRLERHPDFRVSGHDLHSTLKLQAWQAVLGTVATVKTPYGESKIRIPEGTQSGTNFRLAEKGLPKGKHGGTGDLFAEVTIEIPQTLSAEEKKKWQELAELSQPK